MQTQTMRRARTAVIAGILTIAGGPAWAGEPMKLNGPQPKPAMPEVAAQDKPTPGWTTIVTIEATCREQISGESRIAGSDEQANLIARHAAMRHWRSNAEQRFGFDFRHWWQASQRTVACHVEQGATVCAASATPCVKVARGLPKHFATN